MTETTTTTNTTNKTNPTMKRMKVCIVGAGPAGLLLAHYLIRGDVVVDDGDSTEGKDWRHDVSRSPNEQDDKKKKPKDVKKEEYDEDERECRPVDVRVHYDVHIYERRSDMSTVVRHGDPEEEKEENRENKEKYNENNNNNNNKESESKSSTMSPNLGRTFPLALESRGMNALRSMPGLVDAMQNATGSTELVGMNLYNGGRSNKKPRKVDREPFLGIDRNILVHTLLEELVKASSSSNNGNENRTEENKTKNTTTHRSAATADVAPTTSTLNLHFGVSVERINVARKTLVIRDCNKGSSSSTTSETTPNDEEILLKEDEVDYDILVAADGARSRIRRQLAQQTDLTFEEKVVPNAYKSIYVSTTYERDGTIHSLESNRLHRWMIPGMGIQAINVPLHDDYCSGAFVFPVGDDPFEKMTTTSEVHEYFQAMDPYVFSRLVSDDEAEALLKRPTSTLLSVQTDRLHFGDSVLLLGDAAHAVSASLAQGCNSALQDVGIFFDILRKHRHNWSEALPAFTDDRLEDVHAVRTLSDYCFPSSSRGGGSVSGGSVGGSSSSRWLQFEFIARIILRSLLPTWIADYCLRPLPMEVLTKTDLPYRQVLEKCRWWTNRVMASMTANERKSKQEY